jgi:hypothetical protein
LKDGIQVAIILSFEKILVETFRLGFQHILITASRAILQSQKMDPILPRPRSTLRVKIAGIPITSSQPLDPRNLADHNLFPSQKLRNAPKEGLFFP